MKQFINAAETPPPKDGSLLLLLVRIVDDDEYFPTEDSRVFRTIGFNSLSDTGEDKWKCAGWCWCHDKFTETTGKVIGWTHLPATPEWVKLDEQNSATE